MSNRYDLPQLPFDGITTYSLQERKNLVDCRDFVSLGRWQESGDFRDLLPHLLKAQELLAVVEAVLLAWDRGRPVIAALGGHVIKCGLSPLIIDLMRRGIIRAVALSGAGAIHDYELALQGKTSEDVREGIREGRFGMAQETAQQINEAIAGRVNEEIGIGEALGAEISHRTLPFRELSLLAIGYELAIPVTVHVAIGTDIVHMHPSADGGSMGQGSLNDFRLLTSAMAALDGGGCYLNVGSAVLLPEVFLKALTLLRNLGHPMEDFVTVNLDMLQHYRPTVNVVSRPHQGGAGKGYALTGHHEIMLPLIYFLLISRLNQESGGRAASATELCQTSEKP